MIVVLREALCPTHDVISANNQATINHQAAQTRQPTRPRRNQNPRRAINQLQREARQQTSAMQQQHQQQPASLACTEHYRTAYHNTEHTTIRHHLPQLITRHDTSCATPPAAPGLRDATHTTITDPTTTPVRLPQKPLLPRTLRHATAAISMHSRRKPYRTATRTTARRHAQPQRTQPSIVNISHTYTTDTPGIT